MVHCQSTTNLGALYNSTFYANVARDGGGIANYVGLMEISHSTIASNFGNSGGGVWIWSPGCTRVVGTIIAGNSAVDGDVTRFSGERFFSLGYNVIGRAGANVDFGQEFNATGDTVNSYAILGPLANNGGNTMTRALLAGSPGIDRIPLGTAFCILDTSTDQRGAVRGSGTNRGDGACDTGAFEFNSNQIPTAVSLQTFSANPTPPLDLAGVGLLALLLVSGLLLRQRQPRRFPARVRHQR